MRPKEPKEPKDFANIVSMRPTDDTLNKLVEEHQNNLRLIEQTDAEGGTAIGYEKFKALQKRNTQIEEILKNARKVADEEDKFKPKEEVVDNVQATYEEKIDWLVKNVSPTAEQTIPPKAALESMLKDGREDLIDHFYEMHTKELGKPKINIDTSDLKHPGLVKKMMMDEKLKPTLVKTSASFA